MIGQCQNLKRNLNEASMKAENLVIEEKELLSDFKNTEQSLTQRLKTDVNVERVGDLASIISKISFRNDDEREIGSVGVPSNEWEKKDEFETGLNMLASWSIGTIKNKEVVIRDAIGGAIYIKNIEDKTTRKLISGDFAYHISSCTDLEDGRIVCATTNRMIILYDPSWKHIRTIKLPVEDLEKKEEKGDEVKEEENENEESEEGREEETYDSFVVVDKDGMIVSLVSGSHTICIYNPDDGMLVRSMTLSGGPLYDIGCLSTGDMVVVTSCMEGDDVCVVDGSGVVKSTTHLHHKNVKSIAVDHSTDLIYVAYFLHSECFVDVLSPNGESISERIVTFTMDVYLPKLYCSMAGAGKLVVGSGSNIGVFKQKLKSLGELSL